MHASATRLVCCELSEYMSCMELAVAGYCIPLWSDAAPMRMVMVDVLVRGANDGAIT